MKSITDTLFELEKMHHQGKYLAVADKLKHLITSQKDNMSQAELCGAYSLWGMTEYYLGRLAAAVSAYEQAVLCAPKLQNQRYFYSNILFLAHYLPIPKDVLQAKHFGFQLFFEHVKQFAHTIERHNHKKKHIGYISTDFYSHVVTNFSIQLLAEYDREKYKVYCYSWQDGSDCATEQIKTLVDHYTTLKGLDFQEAARKIYDDEIDILFDLAGHSVGGETLTVCSYKPAPVQLCGIGWFNTTGLKAMDYFLSDVYCSPVGKYDEDFSEKIIRLPHTHFCYTPNKDAVEMERSYVVHSPIVFGCFNNFCKVTDDVLRLWLRIVNRVPRSRLILKNAQSNRDYQHRKMWERAMKIGFTPEQLELRKSSVGPLYEYMDIDIALDPFDYVGGGSTCDALYYGVPVITLEGCRHGSRFGVSFLENVGLSELIAKDKDEYVEIAVALADNPELINLLHKNLKAMMEQSPLMDAKAYVADVEAVYEQIWNKWVSENS